MADIIFRCPHCPQHLRAADAEVGKRLTCQHCHTESIVPIAAEQIVCAECHTVIRISIFDLRETFRCPGCNAELRFSGDAETAAAETKPEHRGWSLFGASGWRIIDCLTGKLHRIETFPFEIGSDERAHLHARGALARHCAFEEDGSALRVIKHDRLSPLLINGADAPQVSQLSRGHEYTLRIGPHYYIVHGGRRIEQWDAQVDASQWQLCDARTGNLEGPYTRRELIVILDQHPRDRDNTFVRPVGAQTGFTLRQFSEALELFRFQRRTEIAGTQPEQPSPPPEKRRPMFELTSDDGETPEHLPDAASAPPAKPERLADIGIPLIVEQTPGAETAGTLTEHDVERAVVSKPERGCDVTPVVLGPPLLELRDITLEITQGDTTARLLNDIKLEVPGAHLLAIVGASGCGKSTLLKVIAGIMEPTAGAVCWRNRDLAEEDLAPTEIGYVPQFSIVFEHLSIWENLDAALRLRVAGMPASERRERSEKILREVGLLNIAQRRVRVLSGGERRRLSLALESVTKPSLLLCDEVTSGLDPKAEEEVVELMHRLSRENNRLVVSVTHSLRQLSRYDSVAVMYQGCLAFHGPSGEVANYFGVGEVGETFTELAKRPGAEWHAMWQEKRAPYRMVTNEPAPPKPEVEPDETPDVFTQFWVLWQRRTKIFFRDRAQLWLHMALLFGFPCLVVIFALHGLPQMQNLTMGMNVNPVQQLKETTAFMATASRVGSLVSGLVMFQIILLSLMASNNAAREVAAERLIFEKEKLGGLRPMAYLASKAVFLAMLVAAQSVWMAAFVTFVCRFPGDLMAQTWLLLLGNASITAASLGISSLMKSPEQASLVSIYLVGFQIPLSGAFLALPEILGKISRPFIAAYWSWSGVIETMRETRLYDGVLLVTQTDLAGVPLCLWALGFHVVFGLLLAYIGCRQSRWD